MLRRRRRPTWHKASCRKLAVISSFFGGAWYGLLQNPLSMSSQTSRHAYMLVDRSPLFMYAYWNRRKSTCSQPPAVSRTSHCGESFLWHTALASGPPPPHQIELMDLKFLHVHAERPRLSWAVFAPLRAGYSHPAVFRILRAPVVVVTNHRATAELALRSEVQVRTST